VFAQAVRLLTPAENDDTLKALSASFLATTGFRIDFTPSVRWPLRMDQMRRVVGTAARGGHLHGCPRLRTLRQGAVAILAPSPAPRLPATSQDLNSIAQEVAVQITSNVTIYDAWWANVPGLAQHSNSALTPSGTQP
jgi:hypothetical protein